MNDNTIGDNKHSTILTVQPGEKERNSKKQQQQRKMKINDTKTKEKMENELLR